MELQKLLAIPDSISEESIQSTFASIAKSLFNEYEIVKGNDFYDFLEIEFYFFSENHPDISVYKHSLDSGIWHTNLSGVDITLKSSEKCYGGILVRSIIDQKGNVINGPLCTLFALFDNINTNGECFNIPKIVKKNNKETNVNIKATTRFNINKGKYSNKEYRFYNASNDIKWKSGYTAKPR